MSEIKYHLDAHCEAILEEYREHLPLFNESAEKVHSVLKKVLDKAGLVVASIEHRVKTEKSLAGKDPQNVPEDRVPATQYIYVREEDGRVVGMLQLRHCFNEYLEKYAGHIGYSVRPSERRKGYATAMLRYALPHCRALGIRDVLVSCLTDNEASRRTILRNGGVYESTVHEPEMDRDLERYWIHLD